MMEQGGMNLADLDEWIALVEDTRQRLGTLVPNQWARTGLSAILGEDVPAGSYSVLPDYVRKRGTGRDLRDLLEQLHRAREQLAVASGGAVDATD